MASTPYSPSEDESRAMGRLLRDQAARGRARALHRLAGADAPKPGTVADVRARMAEQAARHRIDDAERAKRRGQTPTPANTWIADLRRRRRG